MERAGTIATQAYLSSIQGERLDPLCRFWSIHLKWLGVDLLGIIEAALGGKWTTKGKKNLGWYDILGFECWILNERYAHGHNFPSSKNGYEMIMVFHAPLDNRVILELTLMCS